MGILNNSFDKVVSYFFDVYLKKVFGKKQRNLVLDDFSALNRPNFIFQYVGIVPVSLYKRSSWVTSSALLEWWVNFINKTDVVNVNTNKPPQKPNMSGNIQPIFFLLGGDLCFACSCVVLEFHDMLFNIILKFIGLVC